MLLYDEALEKVGGFGRYQFILLFIMPILSCYGMQFSYLYGLLTYPVAFVCNFNGEGTTWESCSREEICQSLSNGGNIEYTADTKDENYLNGFYTDMDMVCWSDEKIYSFFQVYFIANFCSMFLVSIPDRLGRKNTFALLFLPIAILNF
jgi:hypothetical protein